MTRDRLLVLVEETLESLESFFGRFVVDSSLVSVLAFCFFFFFVAWFFCLLGFFFLGDVEFLFLVWCLSSGLLGFLVDFWEVYFLPCQGVNFR